VVFPPAFDDDPEFSQRIEDFTVEHFVAHSPVDGEDVPAPLKRPYDGLAYWKRSKPNAPTVVGLDLAKNVFYVHVGDASGHAIASKCLTRRELLPFFEVLSACLVGIEARATAHHWARQLQRFGHDVRLIPLGYVKPYVRRGAKNDAADAAAIREAVIRPNMRLVTIKSEGNQAFLMLHRARGLLVRRRTMTACVIRAHLPEYGIIVAQGRH